MPVLRRVVRGGFDLRHYIWEMFEGSAFAALSVATRRRNEVHRAARAEASGSRTARCHSARTFYTLLRVGRRYPTQRREPCRERRFQDRLRPQSKAARGLEAAAQKRDYPDAALLRWLRTMELLKSRSQTQDYLSTAFCRLLASRRSIILRFGWITFQARL